MPNYVTKELQKFQYPTPRRAQFAPHQWTRPNYGDTKQLETPLDTSPPIPEEQNLRNQQILGTLLYYAHGVDWTILTYLKEISEQQENQTQNTEAEITNFL